MTNENESERVITEQEFFTPNQLCERWNLSISTLNTWRSKGTGPKFVRLGGQKVLYRRSAVVAWENKREKLTKTKMKDEKSAKRKRKSTSRKTGK